ncbi:MAG: hypothetical protein ACI4J0_08705 [Huintestinicola sp.]|uniref:hypothetical protein n=1 Tax=Huintestinicola sp. TaxID=2981661 RepID=UPI003EFBFABE
MNGEIIVEIKRPVHLKSPKSYSEEYAVMQFSREEIIMLKLAIRRHIDCSEEEYSHMTRLINASSAGFEVKADKQFAEEYFGVKYQGNFARIMLNRNQFNALCIAVLSSSRELRYIEAAYTDRFTHLQDKLCKVMDGFRKKEYSFVSAADFWVLYKN